MCLIQFAGIWFVNGKFSASWKLIQSVVQKPKATLQGQCFIKLKTQDKEKLKNQQVVDELDDHVASTIVEDSDNEEEDEPVTVFNPPPTVELSVVEEVAEEVVVVAPIATEEPKKVVKRIVKKKE